MIRNAEVCPNYFPENTSVPAVVFRRQISKHRQFCLKLSSFENCRQNTAASTKTFTEKSLQHYFALHFTSYLSIELSTILPHSKTIKNGKKLLVLGENDSRCLSNFLQTHIF